MSLTFQLRICSIATGSVLLLSTGCASIISGRQANVAIDSYPSNAHVVVHDKTGHEVASVNTPGVVSLKRNSRWFMPARYTATIEAPGYQTAEVPINSTLNPWILGNVVFGGVPGLVVDNATGACWKPEQDAIHQQLTPAAYAQQPPISPAIPAGEPMQVAMTATTPAPQQNDQGPAGFPAPVAPLEANPAPVRASVSAGAQSLYR
jgi:hypothetical protein